MKIIIVIGIIGCSLGLLMSAIALACAKGCVPYEDGICTCEEKTVTYKMAPTPTSDEQPPKDKMPSYQREGIHAVITPETKEKNPSTVSDSETGIAHDGVPERK